jgi:hypothetical protein
MLKTTREEELTPTAGHVSGLTSARRARGVGYHGKEAPQPLLRNRAHSMASPVQIKNSYDR